MRNKPLDQALVQPEDAVVEEFDWGQLHWHANGKIGNSDAMTFGRCIIKPGRENPRHYHPNCEEILHVISGTIRHTLGDDEFDVVPGGTVVIPPNIMHNAKNVGTETAVMVITFSSAARQTVGEF